MKWAFLPGCSLHSTAAQYRTSFLGVVRALGIEVEEVPDWNCCGATAAKHFNQQFTLVLAARNLALAEKVAPVLAVPCNLCYNNLTLAAHALQDEAKREQINSHLLPLELRLRGEVAVYHPLKLFLQEVGVERIRQAVVRPLAGLKVVAYYGCLLTRPKEASIGDSNRWPAWLDMLAVTAGATPLPFNAATRCCGGTLALTHPEVALRAAGVILAEARVRGAEAILVTCPMCQLNLERAQIQEKGREKRLLPVLYFTQFLGLALGCDPITVGLKKNLIPLPKEWSSFGAHQARASSSKRAWC
ncbi:Cysteine-rich domain [Moorella glycerini]|uniref:Cysteine-rich domain protein n=1 Tax=Neomoorella stamsii TaxID=1266720 RepID=A0A9X7J0V2_9FIRM|nr:MULTISPECIES: CoB--CoM heterodisulfide reductase iron-sulfur subunit B family protein [Moorella]PRR70385.1 Cysteine-rich domain protein [Moorella stamsii]CEP66390.1 Cysteine-rich domain [Moorella glycerini]